MEHHQKLPYSMWAKIGIGIAAAIITAAIFGLILWGSLSHHW